LLGLARSAKELSFDEAQNSSFSHVISVTPTATNSLLFSVSGLVSQIGSLSFSFLAVPGLSVSAVRSPADDNLWIADFNDIEDDAFTLEGGTAYQVRVSGRTLVSIPGGQAQVSIKVINAVLAAVPDRESYAMLLAGLGLMGVMAARRRIKAER
jgi:hypothetical protein